MPLKMLVTGGAGFIGSNFIRYMLGSHKDCDILNLDKLTYSGNPDNLKELQGEPRYRFMKGDIVDGSTVCEAMKGRDIVLNFAAETHVDRSILSSREFVETDVLGTHTLLEEAKRSGIKRFIQISTDEVYGSIDKGSSTEESPINPSSPYSASKAAADLLVMSYHRTHNLPVTITRCTNVFGPYQYPEKLIPLFVTNLIQGKKIPLYGNGLNVRTWIYVLDACRGIDTVIEKGMPGQIYNIGTKDEKTNIEITSIILAALGRDESFIEYVRDRPGHDKRYSLDFSKLSLLGWKPLFSFEEAMKETIAWYKENEWWWKKLKDKSFGEYYKKQYENRGENCSRR